MEVFAALKRSPLALRARGSAILGVLLELYVKLKKYQSYQNSCKFSLCSNGRHSRFALAAPRFCVVKIEKGAVFLKYKK
jgi:hypothetical protein